MAVHCVSVLLAKCVAYINRKETITENTMADRTSAGLFGEIFNMLAFELPPECGRFKLAQRFFEMMSGYDFDPCQMEADEALVELGLAHKQGDCMFYGPTEAKGDAT